MKNILLVISVFILVACNPSESAIQTAMAQTQAALPTLTLTPTIIPSPTINPCTGVGWSDIESYLKAFDVAAKNLVVGSSIDAYLATLNNIKGKINEVNIDACTEQYRQSLITGLANEIYALKLSLTNGDKDQITSAMTEGAVMVRDTIVELKGLGIIVKYP